MEKKTITTFVEGSTLKLVPIDLEHLSLYARWENNPEARLYARSVVPLTKDDLKKRMEPSKEETKSILWFEIHYKPEDRPIGTCEIADINWYNYRFL